MPAHTATDAASDERLPTSASAIGEMRAGGLRYTVSAISRLRESKTMIDMDSIEIKPLTFLVGPNGAGKSAVIRALMERAGELGFAHARHVGALRTAPARSCAVREDAPDSVGRCGENAVAMLLANGARSETSRRLLAKADKWMRAFGIASEVNLRDAGQGRASVELTSPNAGERVNIADACAGAIQILPIIVECYAAPKGALILLEHPEAYLHPRAQGTLGDLLIDATKEGKTLVVETHSEHAIGRIQTNVAEETISQDEAAIHYFAPCEGGVKARELKLDEMGHLDSDNIPEDFFTQGYEESLRHMKAVGKRIRGGSDGK